MHGEVKKIRLWVCRKTKLSSKKRNGRLFMLSDSEYHTDLRSYFSRASRFSLKLLLVLASRSPHELLLRYANCFLYGCAFRYAVGHSERFFLILLNPKQTNMGKDMACWTSRRTFTSRSEIGNGKGNGWKQK